jgi:hypothetical protein
MRVTVADGVAVARSDCRQPDGGRELVSSYKYRIEKVSALPVDRILILTLSDVVLLLDNPVGDAKASPGGRSR